MGWNGDANATLGNVGEEGDDSPWPDDLHLPTYTPTYTPPNTSPLPPSVLHNLSSYANQSAPSSRPEVLGPGYHKQLRQGILGVMFVVALLGNCRVMWSLKGKWGSRGRMTILTFNITLADLFVTFFTILGQLIWEVLDMRWYMSNVACKLYKVASTYAITSSNYMLVAMAIDRHEAIVRPLNPFISAKNLVLAAWAVSLLPSLPNLFIFVRYVTPMGDAYCVSKFYTKDLDTNFRQVYLVVVLILVFVSCQILILIFNLRVYLTIWRQALFFWSGQRDSGSSGGGSVTGRVGGGVGGGEGQQQQQQLQQQQRTNSSLMAKAKAKTLSMTIVISLAFFVTNTPYVIQELIMAFGDMYKIHPNILALFGIISASNSALNPYIYLVFCPKGERRRSYPESYRVTFSRRWNRSPSNPPGSAKACLLQFNNSGIKGTTK